MAAAEPVIPLTRIDPELITKDKKGTKNTKDKHRDTENTEGT